MIDSYVWLTPVLMLPIVALLVFVGCSFKIGVLSGTDVPIISATAKDGEVELRWTPDIDADKFQIKRGVASGVHALVGEVFSGGFYVDRPVTNGVTYFYVVTAWRGDVETGPSNEESVMPSGVPLKSFVTGKMLGSLVSSASGSFGMVVQTGSAPVNVKTLGRAFAPGNVQTHTVQIIDAVSGAGVSGAFVSVAMAGGTDGVFKYAPLANAVSLNPNSRYYLVSQETAGGDQFYNHDTTVTTTGVASVPASVRGDGVTFMEDSVGAAAYGPLDFQYT